MSKNINKKKDNNLPTIPEKYLNMNKLEETEHRLIEEKVHSDTLQKDYFDLFNELKKKETEFV